jgi:hypothetical protein
MQYFSFHQISASQMRGYTVSLNIQLFSLSVFLSVCIAANGWCKCSAEFRSTQLSGLHGAKPAHYNFLF